MLILAHYRKCPEYKSIQTDSRLVVARVWRIEGRLTFVGIVGFLELHRDDGGAIMEMYFQPLNCTLEKMNEI